MRQGLAPLACCALLLASSQLEAAPAHYEARALGTLGGASIVPHAINNKGQVAGNGQDSYTRWRAFRSRSGQPVAASDALAVPEGKDALFANDLAEDGTVVGYSKDSGSWRTPFFWPAAGGVVEASTAGELWAINRAGDLVGCTAVSRDGRAVMAPFLRRRDGSTATLTTVGGSSCAYGINEAGLIVGEYRASPTAAERAFSWDGGAALRELGPLPVTYSHARDVNGAGRWIAYGSDGASSAHRAFVGNIDGTFTELPAPPGTFNVIADAINDADIVVGSVQRGSKFYAALWHVGTLPIEAIELGPRIRGLSGELRGIHVLNDEGVMAADIVGGPAIVISPVRLSIEQSGPTEAGRPKAFVVRNCEPGARVSLMKGTRRARLPYAHRVSGVRFDLDDVVRLGPEVSADAAGVARFSVNVSATPGIALLQVVQRGNKSPVLALIVKEPAPIVGPKIQLPPQIPTLPPGSKLPVK